jgi:hypothetical protein
MKRCDFQLLKLKTMDNVLKPSDSVIIHRRQNHLDSTSRDLVSHPATSHFTDT